MSIGRSARALGAALFCSVVMATVEAHAADYVLRFATISVAEAANYKQILEPYARAVEADSQGRIEMAIKPLGGYGKPTELFNMLEKGDVEIVSSVQGYSPGRFPQSSVMELPLMYDDSISGTKAMWQLYKEGYFDKDYASVKVLGLYVLPPYAIFTTGKKITTLRDFRGLRMRTPSPTVGLSLTKLGTIPLGVPVNMIGDAIDSDTVDAIAFGWDSLPTTKGAGGKMVADQVSVLVDANFAAPALMIVMNKAAWEKLPPDLQAIMEKHADMLTLGNAQVREASEAATKKRLAADPRYTYIAFSAEQRAEMKRKIAPAIDGWKASLAKSGIDGEKLLARARELIQQYKVAAK
jgi:TRAP-type transport system periplasmic protein